MWHTWVVGPIALFAFARVSSTTPIDSGAGAVSDVFNGNACGGTYHDLWCALPVLPDSRADRAWSSYLFRVYGPGVKYPFDLKKLRWIYACLGEAEACSQVPAPAPVDWSLADAPSLLEPSDTARPGLAWRFSTAATDGTAATQALLNPYGFFIGPTHTGSFGAPSHSWIEVIRVHSEREQRLFGQMATWYFAAPGSGIWLNLGHTVVHEHEVARRPPAATIPTSWNDLPAALSDLHARFQSRRTRSPTEAAREEHEQMLGLVKRYLSYGYDTFQIPSSQGNKVDEIVDLRELVQNTTAGADQPSAMCRTGNMRRGPKANLPCHCAASTEQLLRSPVLRCV